MMENICLGSGKNQEKLDKISKISGLNDIISKLPDGWNTNLGRSFDENGHELSGDQWQKVALARSLYRDAPILILDEPTAAIDAESEAELFSKYGELTKNKLALLITHRFNTVKFADRILVLENGGIIEDGNHSKLMKLNGRYAEMFSKQADSYDIKLD